MHCTAASTRIWNPSSAEVAAILEEMRPIIAQFADRDRRRMAAWKQAGSG